ncbi:MAG TPA: DinB family protein, partial [Methylomirabilota bacterium]|nr:DinB family protein [Methylomirabilota bacterium]
MDQTLVVPSLASTPRLLRSMSGDCTPEQAWAPPKPGEWSIGLVVRHLLEGEFDTFLPRLKRMLAEERPVFDQRGGTCIYGQNLAVLLDDFEAKRTEAVEILRSLDAAAWQRQGVSPSRGALSIAEYARTMAEHDIEHLRQIHDVRQTLGLKPKRCEARLTLPLGEVIAAIEPGPQRVRELGEGLTAVQ